MPAHGKRRALGQHFLRDAKVISLITDTTLELVRENHCPALLEIGPGRGAITDPIRERLSREKDAPEFFVAERDRDLVAFWKERGIRVEAGDFVELPETQWLGKFPLGIVSNLPYSAGTAIVTRLAAHFAEIPFMVLMFQAEVAQRLRAEPDTKSWGSLSVWIQNRWDCRKLCSVPPAAFAPPPDVQSEVLVLTRRAEPRIAVSDNRAWEGLLKACFAQRRKMLRAGLRGYPKQYQALKLSGIDETKRAEALDWAEWEKLYRALSGSN